MTFPMDWNRFERNKMKINQKTQKKTMGSQCLTLKGCRACSKKILFWTIAGNVFLAIIKLLGSVISGSSGLMADGLQSVSCIVASVIIMYSLVISQKKSNSEFPYGYGKIEFIVALIVFSSLVGLGLFIAIYNLLLIIHKDTATPGILGLPIAAISVFLTYLMYKYNVCAGKKLDSPGMIANGYQARADMYSSTAVSVGIMLAQISPRFAVFDQIAALFVGCLIFKDSFQHWFVNLKVILDEVPDENYEKKVAEIISKLVEDSQHKVIKLKRMGKNFWIGIEIYFADDQTVSEIEVLKNKLKKEICQKIPWIGHVDFFLK